MKNVKRFLQNCEQFTHIPTSQWAAFYIDTQSGIDKMHDLTAVLRPPRLLTFLWQKYLPFVNTFLLQHFNYLL